MLKLKLIKKEPLKLKVTSSFPPIIPANFQDKEVIPSVEMQTITPDRGFDGLSEVRVLGDEDLQASNIKQGIEIFGVTGSVEEMTQETKEAIVRQEGIVTTQSATVSDIKQVVQQKILTKEKFKPRYIRFTNYDGTELQQELDNLDTSQITNMKEMFYNCPNLTSIDLSNFDVSNVLVMTSMFRSCKKLKTANLSGFGESQCYNIQNMFEGCESLETIDLSNFHTSGSLTIYMPFYGCKRLKHLDIRSLTFDNVNNAMSVFTEVPASCLIIVKGETEKQWVLSQRSDFTNVKTVAELEV
jgi:surface protein